MQNQVFHFRRSHAISFGLIIATLLFSLPLRSASAVDELGDPGQVEIQVAKHISKLLRERHLSRRDLDDEISKRAMKSFFKSLDPAKLYFYQEDIDEFSKQSENIDDFVKNGQLKFPLQVFTRFDQRVEERVATVKKLLAGDFDFTLEEELVTDSDISKYPTSAKEAEDRWRKRIKYNLLVLKSDKTEGEEAREKLRKRYTSFAKRMAQYDTEEVIEMFLTAVTTSYDPHTTYFSKTTYDNFMIQMRLNLEGIGASLQSSDGTTIVKRVVPGGAADKHGKLKVEDHIVSVGQGPKGEMVDVTDMKLDDVVQLIRGKANTIVRLGVKLANTNEQKTYTIVREKIQLADSAAQGEIFEAGTKADGSTYKIGVIDLPSFYADMDGARKGATDYRSTTRDVRKILDDFNAKGVESVVLDLRHNGGGSLSEAINCTGLFIKAGPVVQVKDFFGAVRPLYDEDQSIAWSGPLVVVTSKFSASASEILAGAIQDYKRGLIVGDTSTHGKGTVQSLLDLDRDFFRVEMQPKLMGALKITMQQFYRPEGASTQKKGVVADIVLPSFSDHMDVGEADLDYAIEFDRVRASRFEPFSLVNPQLTGDLTKASKDRIAQSTFFKELDTDINRYIEAKAKKSVSLNEVEFFAQREIDSDKEEEKALEEQINADKKIERDEYLSEVLSIAADYIRMLKENQLAALR